MSSPPRPTIMTSHPDSKTSRGLRYCWPRLSPSTSSPTPGVRTGQSLGSGLREYSSPKYSLSAAFVKSRGGGAGYLSSIRPIAMKPTTKYLFARAIARAAEVYPPVAVLPAEDIPAKRRRPRPRGKPTDLRPAMIPGPGTACAFVRCAQDEVLWTPRECCRVAVLPKSLS